MIEAYLLTTVPFERIAVICGLSTAAVETYHELFFDVRPRMAATDWLLRQAVGWRSAFDHAAPDLGRVWKYLAFSGGLNVLEAVIAVTTNTPLPDWMVNAFSNPAVDQARLRLSVKLYISALTASTQQQSMAVAAIHKRLRRFEKVDDEESEDMMLSAMEAFLAPSPKRYRRYATSLDEAEHLKGGKLLSDGNDERMATLPRYRSFATLVDEAVSTAHEVSIATEMFEVPVGVLESFPRWRSFDDEDPDLNDGIDMERERCRVLVAENG
jgi:hypothetical protein